MTKTQLSICLNNAEVRIAELKKENELLKRVEDIFNASPDLTFDCCKKLFSEDFQAHNLEQHDIAIRNAVKAVITPAIANHWNDDYQRGFMDCTTDILNQAKALKGGKQ